MHFIILWSVDVGIYMLHDNHTGQSLLFGLDFLVYTVMKVSVNKIILSPPQRILSTRNTEGSLDRFIVPEIL